MVLHTHTAQVIYYGHGSLSNMHHHLVEYFTLSLAQACSYQQNNAYFEAISLDSVPCGFSSLAQGCRPSTPSQSEHMCELCVARQKFLVKYFCKRVKICEIRKIKDQQKNFTLYSIYNICSVYKDSTYPYNIL